MHDFSIDGPFAVRIGAAVFALDRGRGPMAV